MESSGQVTAHKPEPVDEITLVLSQEDGCRICPHLRHALSWIFVQTHQHRLPAGIRQVMAVMEPHGKITLQRQPSSQSEHTCDTIAVVTANLWHDFPRFRQQVLRLERFARLVEEARADILLLQEVTRRPGLQADAWLADRLGMAYVYSRANGHQEIGFEEGLAVMSRYPIQEMPHVYRLSQGCNPFVRRLLLGAQINTACGSMLAVSVHLGLPPKQNARQLSQLERWIHHLPLDSPVVVGGDFNASEKSQQIQKARKKWLDTYRHIHPHQPAVTHEIKGPFGISWLRQRLDYIFLRSGNTPWQVIDVEHLAPYDGPHSDHHSVLARLAPVIEP